MAALDLLFIFMCLIKIIDKTGKELIFVTNIDELFSEEIAFVYKKR